MTRLRWAAASTAALALAATLLSGCTEVKTALNKGGDTPCSDYVKQDQDTQRMTITKFVKQQTGDKNEPSGTAVDATIIAVNFLCSNQRNASTPIKNANVAGIFLNN
jgi:acid stress chaperone HdeA